MITAHDNDFLKTHYLFIYFKLLMPAVPMRRLTIITIHYSREHNITAVTYSRHSNTSVTTLDLVSKETYTHKLLIVDLQHSVRDFHSGHHFSCLLPRPPHLSNSFPVSVQTNVFKPSIAWKCSE